MQKLNRTLLRKGRYVHYNVNLFQIRELEGNNLRISCRIFVRLQGVVTVA
ncbi:hypothetical protein BuS5_03933 [Desulfosarcina sp. BuS5]|nr:hypothetical protein BuS5_03933 [Desulfosarcina sp. BuS5]